MYDVGEEVREVERALGHLLPVPVTVGAAPPLRLAGTDEDDGEFTIVRGID